MIKTILKYKYLYLGGFLKLIRKRNSFLYATGWDKSFKEGKPLDNTGNFVPWMNYPIIGFLKERLRPDLTLFEFGSGYSTLFYAPRVKSVTAVEYDHKWYHWITGAAPDNVETLFKEKDEDGFYAQSISARSEKYDVIVVDGADRRNCLKYSVESLSDKGVILLDDSHRERYVEAIGVLMAKGFRVLHFEGLKPCGYKMYRASVFYRSNNCFEI